MKSFCVWVQSLILVTLLTSLLGCLPLFAATKQNKTPPPISSFCENALTSDLKKIKNYDEGEFEYADDVIDLAFEAKSTFTRKKAENTVFKSFSQESHVFVINTLSRFIPIIVNKKSFDEAGKRFIEKIVKKGMELECFHPPQYVIFAALELKHQIFSPQIKDEIAKFLGYSNLESFFEEPKTTHNALLELDLLSPKMTTISWEKIRKLKNLENISAPALDGLERIWKRKFLILGKLDSATRLRFLEVTVEVFTSQAMINTDETMHEYCLHFLSGKFLAVLLRTLREGEINENSWLFLKSMALLEKIMPIANHDFVEEIVTADAAVPLRLKKKAYERGLELIAKEPYSKASLILKKTFENPLLDLDSKI